MSNKREEIRQEVQKALETRDSVETAAFYLETELKAELTPDLHLTYVSGGLHSGHIVFTVDESPVDWWFKILFEDILFEEENNHWIEDMVLAMDVPGRKNRA